MDTQADIIVTLESKEKLYSYSDLGLSYDSSDEEILSALRGILVEQEGVDIEEEYEDGYFTIKRLEDDQKIRIFPKSTAGHVL